MDADDLAKQGARASRWGFHYTWQALKVSVYEAVN